MSGIGRIERVPLRDAWPHEALDFTRWLAENLDLLGDVVRLNLSLIEREQRVGDFSVDLVAQDSSGDLVVIENQLERSDHDHLGKLITYLAMVGAKRAIWIVAEPRAEHLKAVQWLNEAGGGQFYLLKLEAVRIGTSLSAPLITLITGPSEAMDEAKGVRQKQVDSTNRYVRFWSALLDYSRTKTLLHRNLSPSSGSWISSPADMPSCYGLNYALSRGRGRVELYIDDSRKGKTFVEGVFHAIEAHRSEAEATFGAPIDWQELPDGRACRICAWITPTVDLGDESTWPPFIEALVDAMIRFDQALRPFVVDAVRAGDEALRLALKEDELG